MKFNVMIFLMEELIEPLSTILLQSKFYSQFVSIFAEILLHIYWTKVKTLHLNCVPFIYKMMQANKANENVFECSKTELCIKVKVLRMMSQGNAWKPFKCDRAQFFRLQIWTEISHSLGFQKSHFQPDPTAQNGSLDMWQPEMWRTYHKRLIDC